MHAVLAGRHVALALLRDGDDTGLLMALNAVSTGWFIEECGLLYRKWPGQSTAQDAHHHEAERRARMKIIEQNAPKP
ncbi:hypothetical protein [Streptomyces sp. NPDC087787]|uniref:hypothetical protein n=1 Tax=Streptomyces sp. NPDC087787 TaxID=3365803 RepID=UPI0037FBD572